MSKSYKKTPWCGEHKGKSKKRIANHHVRNWFKRNPDVILPPGAYKKIHCSWDICDYGWICTWEDYWNDCQKWHQEAINRGWGHYANLDKNEEYRKWLKYYKNK